MFIRSILFAVFILNFSPYQQATSSGMTDNKPFRTMFPETPHP